MAQESIKQPKEAEALKRLLGKWSVGVALKTADGKVVSGCGEMDAKETDSTINLEVNTQIEGYEDYYENQLWTYDPVSGKVHLFSITSEGQTRDHVGKWVDDSTLELHWRGTYEDQDQEEHIVARWVSEDHIELKQTNYAQGKPLLTTDYVFKRREA
ncbi:MAG: hypothetical protein M1540_05030 [Candidatus Bathyarchaeota archaeon]|nr:hypothetical protein [Candidatus Bathyarchaeota archaeon]